MLARAQIGNERLAAERILANPQDPCDRIYKELAGSTRVKGLSTQLESVARRSIEEHEPGGRSITGGARQASLYIFWLRDDSLEDTDNLPATEIIAAEIVKDLAPR